MWWQKLNKAKKAADDEQARAEENKNEGPFDFERIIKELTERKQDIRPSDVVMFPEPLRSTLNTAIRIGRISLTEFAKMMENMDIEKARQLTKLLTARNLLHVSPMSDDKETFYETRLSAMTRPLTRPPSDIWKKLDE